MAVSATPIARAVAAELLGTKDDTRAIIHTWGSAARRAGRRDGGCWGLRKLCLAVNACEARGTHALHDIAENPARSTILALIASPLETFVSNEMAFQSIYDLEQHRLLRHIFLVEQPLGREAFRDRTDEVC